MKSSSHTSNNLHEEMVESSLVHQGRSYACWNDRVRLPDGRMTDKLYLKYPDAVGIVPFLDEETIVLVRQFRYPIGREIFEIPAGKMEEGGETQLQAARRELVEETGYAAQKFEHLVSYYPAPGYATEMLHIYTARGLTPQSQFLDDDEFIEVRPVKITEAVQMMRQGEIVDSKTIIALLKITSK